MKMIKILKVFSFLTLLVIQTKAISQEKFLQLSNPNKEKVQLFKADDRLRVQSYDDIVFRGKLSFYNDSTIKIDRFYVPISSIKEIKKLNRVQTALGVGVIGFGVYQEAIIFNRFLGSCNFSEVILYAGYMFKTAFISLGTGIGLMVIKKSYDLKDDWNIAIVEQISKSL